MNQPTISTWRRFWLAVDNEGVGLFQTMGYVIISAAMAPYNLFFTDAPSVAVAGVMGHPYYEVWLSLLMLMPLVCLTGKRLTGNLTLTGMLMQLLGDLGTTAALLLFTASSVMTTTWGAEGNVGGFTTFILLLCTIVFILRDVRRLLQVESRHRHE